ncbi:MAG: COX15/CtaA family protein [archaeon]
MGKPAGMTGAKCLAGVPAFMNRRFRYLVATTTLFVFATILLGVATKSYGAGLACQARWPVCDGGLLNLFPESFPSFFEWIHRVVAGVGGVFIVGAALQGWRLEAPDGVKYALTIGAVLTPLQVLLGQQTVVNFTFPILSAHFWTAFTIFGAFAYVLVRTWQESIQTVHVKGAAIAAVVLFAFQVLLTPPFISSYTPVIQTLQYAVLLTLVLCVLVLVVGRRQLARAYQFTPVVALATLPVAVYLSRHLLAASTVQQVVYGLVSSVVFGALLLTAFSVRGLEPSLEL